MDSMSGRWAVLVVPGYFGADARFRRADMGGREGTTAAGSGLGKMRKSQTVVVVAGGGW